MRPAVFPAPAFPDHALLDSGAGEKLERFGRIVLRRPDPQALWRPRLEPAAWERADLTFERESDRGGRWRRRAGAPAEVRGDDARWTIAFGPARFVLRPTPFKHVGLFPEQAANWDAVARALEQITGEVRVLNLFGYTGAASVLAAKAGARVTHVDASKTSIGWTLENAVASGLGRDALRVLCDDALAFARREVRRGSRYEVILLDPPHYGRGPKGEVWRFEEGFAPLIEAVRELLADQALLVLSTYAIGYSPLAFTNVLAELPEGEVSGRELALAEDQGDVASTPRLLPAGFCARWWRGLELGGRRVKLDVLHVDNHVLAVSKPAGLPVAPDASGDVSLLDLAREWIREEFSKPGKVFVGLVHRLDRPVSGVVVLGRTSKGAARLTEAFRARTARKTYLGLVPETPRDGWPGEWRELEQWLLKDRERNHVSPARAGAPGAREAVTRWRVLAPGAPALGARPARPCVLELEPQTGRSHQLRLAARAVAAPLLGDLRYGASEPLADRSIGLHALRLELPHPTRDEALELFAPPPALAVWDAARAALGDSAP